MIVVLGILATLVVPRMSDAAERSEKTAFISDLQQFGTAARLFHLEHGEYLADGDTGTVPAGFEDYVRPEDWTRPTPIGGLWDAELRESGITSAIGVYFKFAEGRKDDAFMAEVDAMFDDGSLSSGSFRKIAKQRYYLILER